MFEDFTDSIHGVGVVPGRVHGFGKFNLIFAENSTLIYIQHIFVILGHLADVRCQLNMELERAQLIVQVTSEASGCVVIFMEMPIG